MVYKIAAVHTWGLNLGIVEYITGGEDFSEVAVNAIESFPKMKFDLPVGPLSENTLCTCLHNVMDAYLADFKLEVSRSVESRTQTFLKSLSREYRRWKFDESMDLGAAPSIMEDLVPLIKLHQTNVAAGESLTRTVVDYCTDMLSELFAEAVVSTFGETVEMFLAAHTGKIKRLTLTLDFPKCQYRLMDMRLLIDV